MILLFPRPAICSVRMLSADCHRMVRMRMRVCDAPLNHARGDVILLIPHRTIRWCVCCPLTRNVSGYATRSLGMPSQVACNGGAARPQGGFAPAVPCSDHAEWLSGL